MTFGPFLLKSVEVTDDSLVLVMADEKNNILYKPKRFLSFAYSAEYQAHAEKLVGKFVTTETSNEFKNSPKEWWKSVRLYVPPDINIHRKDIDKMGFCAKRRDNIKSD